MDYKIGFIGAGKMVAHIVNGLLNEEDMKGKIIVAGRNREKLEQFNIDKDIEISTDYNRLSQCKIIVVGVSTSAVVPVFKKLDEIVSGHDEKIFISVAGWVSLNDIESVFSGRKVIRCMPNITVSANEGVMVMTANDRVDPMDQHYINDLFRSLGIVEWVDENLMRYVPSLTGSSPAYVFIMVEAMADKAVSVGFSRKQAYRLAAQALVGAGIMLLKTDEHPGALKDQITTSGGSTIQGVMRLEQEGFRDSVMQAMEAVNNANEK